MDTSLPDVNAQPELAAIFVSDIHLSAGMPKTTDAFLAFLKTWATKAKQLYLLGDLFEYWPGDDAISEPYNQKIIDSLNSLKLKGIQLYWVAGNRDFLVGNDFATATGAMPLSDPSLIHICGNKIIISHGDAECTDDVAYIEFRKKVRHPQWQLEFLSAPLEQRKAVIEGMRNNSKLEQQKKSAAIMDVNPEAINRLFSSLKAKILIHGHTHRPATHIKETGDIRYVLPDWDCESPSIRGGWIGIDNEGNIEQYDLNGNTVHYG